ncbi:MAG: helix-turn-helix transcriptional regulator [Slackia sp.]|nr:helix-turn-helix transcriptional regulator [Slackia sp.]
MPSIHPRHLGFALALSWSYFMMRATLSSALAGASALYFLAMAASLAVFAAFAHKNRITPAVEAASDLIASAGLAAAALLCLYPVPAIAHACLLASAAIGGCGIAWAYMRFGTALAHIDLKTAAAIVLVSAAASALFKTAIDFAPRPLEAALLVGIAAGMTYCLRKGERDLPAANVARRFYNKRTIAPLWHLGAGIAVFSLVFGAMQATLLSEGPHSAVAASLVQHGSELALAIVTLVFALPLGRGLDFSKNWRLVLMLMMAALLLYSDIPAAYADSLLAFVRTAQTFLVVFLVLALADIARHSVFHPAIVFSTGWICYAVPHALGSLLPWAAPLQSAHLPVAFSLAALLLIFVTFFLLDEESVGNRVLFSELNDADGEDETLRLERMQNDIEALERTQEREKEHGEHAGGDLIEFKCSLLSKRHALTPRESEVLVLLAHGRSKAYIADTFIISENTVRGHVKRLYAKLDVHSKQELLDLVDSTTR